MTETISSVNLKDITDKYNILLQKIYDKFFPHFMDMLLSSFSDVIQKITENLLSNPVELFKHQIEYYQKQSNLLHNLNEYQPPEDKRFKHEQWQGNLLYSYIRGSYHLTSELMEKVINNIQFDNEKQKQKALFLIKQVNNAFSPTNFCWSNPEIIDTFYKTGGQSLIKGLDNLLKDIENSQNNLNITTTDNNYFKLGINIATSKGEVVFQNELIQLIHYYPLKEKNFEVPILIVPPCINKFYIFDLSEKNSFVKFLLENGFNVFIISWKNPNKSNSNFSFSDYVNKGVIAAIDFMTHSYKYAKISAIGYCIGGTILTLANAYLEEQKRNNIVSNLLLTTLLDFEESGEVSLFIDEKSVDSLSKHVIEQGFISGEELSLTFSMLRANDMIWNFYVNNYLLGKDPFPFDILYWNSDSTCLPAKMYIEYLRRFYLENILAKTKEYLIEGIKVNIEKIKSPIYFLAAKEDHIVPWQSSYKSLELLQKRFNKFVLAGSGHVAGVFNPPSSGKYYYYTNDKQEKNAETWLEQAVKTNGSWWNDWFEWQKQFGGKLEKSAIPLLSLEVAPGSYVKRRNG